MGYATKGKRNGMKEPFVSRSFFLKLRKSPCLGGLAVSVGVTAIIFSASRLRLYFSNSSGPEVRKSENYLDRSGSRSGLSNVEDAKKDSLSNYTPVFRLHGVISSLKNKSLCVCIFALCGYLHFRKNLTQILKF
jgi:hypothetical protein